MKDSPTTDKEMLDWAVEHNAEVRRTSNNGLYWVNWDWKDGQPRQQTILSNDVKDIRTAILIAMGRIQEAV